MSEPACDDGDDKREGCYKGPRFCSTKKVSTILAISHHAAGVRLIYTTAQLMYPRQDLKGMSTSV